MLLLAFGRSLVTHFVVEMVSLFALGAVSMVCCWQNALA